MSEKKYTNIPDEVKLQLIIDYFTNGDTPTEVIPTDDIGFTNFIMALYSYQEESIKPEKPHKSKPYIVSQNQEELALAA